MPPAPAPPSTHIWLLCISAPNPDRTVHEAALVTWVQVTPLLDAQTSLTLPPRALVIPPSTQSWPLFVSAPKLDRPTHGAVLVAKVQSTPRTVRCGAKPAASRAALLAVA